MRIVVDAQGREWSVEQVGAVDPSVLGDGAGGRYVGIAMLRCRCEDERFYVDAPRSWSSMPEGALVTLIALEATEREASGV